MDSEGLDLQIVAAAEPDAVYCRLPSIDTVFGLLTTRQSLVRVLVTRHHAVAQPVRDPHLVISDQSALLKTSTSTTSLVAICKTSRSSASE